MNHRVSLSRLADDTSGNVLMIFAAALIPLTAIVGSGLDLSIAYMARAKLQNACDAAALAGRQAMEGNSWNAQSEAEARKFFDFNFPNRAYRSHSGSFVIGPDASDSAQIVGSANALVPTSIMHIFGKDNIAISVACDAKRDLGHNDVVLVLDVTGSMNLMPSWGGDETKVELLRTGASGLFRALDDAENGSITRYGIVPYSHTVNVGRSLQNRDFLVKQVYNDAYWTYTECKTNGASIWDCAAKEAETRPTGGVQGNRYRYNIEQQGRSKTVHISNGSWYGNRQGFRTSGRACIEERPTIGNEASPVRIEDYVTREDVDAVVRNGDDEERQFGRYDPAVQEGESQSGCPSEATTLREYDDEDAFAQAVRNATAEVTDGTYHDVGLLWGARFLSRTGFFAADNEPDIDGVPVNQHIVFMTDGELDTGPTLYSAHGIERYQNRTQGDGSQDEKHLARFASACNTAKSMGMTIWVIALDEADVDDIRPCATSEAHFFISDGSDLEQVFSAIGQGIGNLRLTR